MASDIRIDNGQVETKNDTECIKDGERLHNRHGRNPRSTDENLFPDDDRERDTPEHRLIRTQVANNVTTGENIPEFTMGELEGVIMKLKNRKAPGTDGLTNEIVKMLSKQKKKAYCR